MDPTIAEFVKVAGIPAFICLAFMFGVYKILRPVSDLLIKTLNQTVEVNSSILARLDRIVVEDDKAKALAATVTAKLDDAHRSLAAEHQIIIEKLGGMK